MVLHTKGMWRATLYPQNFTDETFFLGISQIIEISKVQASYSYTVMRRQVQLALASQRTLV